MLLISTAFLGSTKVWSDNCSGTAETSSGNQIFTVTAQQRRHLSNHSLYISVFSTDAQWLKGVSYHYYPYNYAAPVYIPFLKQQNDSQDVILILTWVKSWNDHHFQLIRRSLWAGSPAWSKAQLRAGVRTELPPPLSGLSFSSCFLPERVDISCHISPRSGNSRVTQCLKSCSPASYNLAQPLLLFLPRS